MSDIDWPSDPKVVQLETKKLCTCGANSFEAQQDALPQMMVNKAYQLLKSGAELTASELKVCLDITRAYGVEIKDEPKNVLTESLPFDEE
tara:strand:- start:2547 stop:2816 length:270 start_codon:yes stop_codon:yes gene_type:complete